MLRKLGPAKIDPETGTFAGRRGKQIQKVLLEAINADTPEKREQLVDESKRLMWGDSRREDGGKHAPSS